MNKIFKTFIFLLILMSATSVSANNKYGAWAEDAINIAIACGIINDDASRDYFAPITRIEIAELISNAYKNITACDINYPSQHFADTSDKSANVVSSLGIMNGYGDGNFLPNAFTSRQEMAKIILTYQSVIKNSPLVLPDTFSCTFTDFNDLSPWAKPYVEKAVNEQLLNGYVDGSFGGKNSISWQEAIVLVERVENFLTPVTQEPELNSDFNLLLDISGNMLNIRWNRIYNSPHILTITEKRLSRYAGDIPANTPEVITLDNGAEFSTEINPNKEYTVTISCNDKYFTKSIVSEKVYFDDMEQIRASYPSAKEEADALMTEITVPVWQLSGDEKIASEATVIVHSAIAEKLLLVFEEIFNGEEKFPIKDIGGYSWRGGVTEHNGGTAIDINSNENYCIYNDGTTIGSFWKPYENPYSITPYGDVIKAFEKYGFTWGGDSWSNPRDYMHFSYLGT